MKEQNTKNKDFLSGPEILKEMNISWSGEMLDETADQYSKVSRVIPEVEWPFFAPYIKAINILKKDMNAVILAHNYQTPEIFHCISDIRGDSLQLAIEAGYVNADIILQCGMDPDHQLRQAAVYGLGIFVEFGGEHFAPFEQKALIKEL